MFDDVVREPGLVSKPLGEMGGAGPGSVEVRVTRGLEVVQRGDADREVELTEALVEQLQEAEGVLRQPSTKESVHQKPDPLRVDRSIHITRTSR